MMLSTLFALAALAPAQSVAAPQPTVPTTRQASAVRSRRAARVNAKRQAALLRRLGQGMGSQSATLGGTFTTGQPGPQIGVGPSLAPGVFQLKLDDPGTGWQETVLLGVPTMLSAQPAPLLVMFHGFDVSEFDCYVNGTDVFEGARNRGWYVLAPLGAHQVNYGIPYSQTNVEYALALFSEVLPIDMNRIYGVGFSMGGGGMMSYAARHQDPNKPQFAAVVNHTGSVSVANAYWNSSDTFIFDHPSTFGGSPATFPFLYSQSSSVDIDALSLAIDPATDMARNLTNTPVLNYHAQFDPNTNLVNVTQALFAWLTAIPLVETYLLTPQQNIHSWSTLDANTVLNYLYSKTLQIPAEGQHRVLADRETRWYHFDVFQDTPGAFTPFRWDFNALANRLTIDETENLQRIVVDSASLGINTAVNLELIMASNDGTADIATLTGYVLQPQGVLRNGTLDNNWTWDAVAQTVTLTGPTAGGEVWVIQP